MNCITSDACFRQRVVKYSYKYGVTTAANRFRRHRKTIYEWREKWDGKSRKSLMEKSHRPHHHPNEHTLEEKEMILRRYPRYRIKYPDIKVIRTAYGEYYTPGDTKRSAGARKFSNKSVIKDAEEYMLRYREE